MDLLKTIAAVVLAGLVLILRVTLDARFEGKQRNGKPYRDGGF